MDGIRIYRRALFLEFERWEDEGWQPVSKDGKPLIEGWCDGELLTGVLWRQEDEQCAAK